MDKIPVKFAELWTKSPLLWTLDIMCLILIILDKTKKVSTVNNNLVVKKNPLVNARYKLNPLEIKILLSVVGLIDKEDSFFWTYDVPVKDLGDYKEIKRSCRSLMTKVFEIKEDNGWLMMNWFSHIRYKSKEGLIECSFDPNLKPYLLQLKDNFTSYTLQSVLPMRSSYSIRLYELLKQYEKIGNRAFNLDDLEDIMQVPKSYRVWRDFNKRVLETAQNEINNLSDITISYSPIKTGRKITSVSFTIAPNLNKLPLKQYITLIRSKCVNMTLLHTKDKESGENVELSVSEKGHLYNKLNPNWKINHKYALKIWALMQEKGIGLN